MLKVEIVRESVYKRDRKKCIGVTRVLLVGVVERGGQPPDGENCDLHPPLPPGREFRREGQSVLHGRAQRHQ